MMTDTVKNSHSKGLTSLLITQFFGAFNDNVFKLAISLLALRLAADKGEGASYISLATAIFVMPFLLFSPYGGWLADRFSKTHVIRSLKVLELGILVAGAYCLFTHHLTWLWALLFLMGLHSALFGPSKYGILPELLPLNDLSKGNGYLQFWTFMAIIAGTAVTGPLMTVYDSMAWLIGAVLCSGAIFGLIASWRMPLTPIQNSHVKWFWNPFGDLLKTLNDIRRERYLLLAMVAAFWFWFTASFFQMNLLLYSKNILLMTEMQISLVMFSVAFGIGLGSITAGFISEGKVELGLVPLGAIGLTLGCLLLGGVMWTAPWVYAVVFALGFFGGLYIVPLSSFIQKASPPEERGRYLAANNFLSFGAMLVSSLFLWISGDLLGSSPKSAFLIIGIAFIIITGIIFKYLPEMFVRCLNWILVHTLYRIRVIGTHHIPTKGGALLVANHASYADPSLLLASIERPVRFMIFREIYEWPLLKPIAKTISAIPISYKDSPKKVLKSLEEAREALKRGELVCIFAEGGHTRIGQMLPFRRGLERIVKDLEAPIIPVHMDKIWGSLLSFKKGRYLWKWPDELPYSITVSFGKPLPSSTSTFHVRQRVLELGAEAFAYRKETHQVLSLGFLRQVKKRPFKKCMTDSILKKTFNFLQTAALSLCLAQVLKKRITSERMVGVLLPTSVAAAWANIALQLLGKVAINLNFTLKEESLRATLNDHQINAVITSRAFLQKLKWSEAANYIFIEDLMKKIKPIGVITNMILILCLPVRWIQKQVASLVPQPTDLATIIFSSGSTGQPKGVMLTHQNISANIHGVYDLYEMQKESVMGILPFFHSFGFTGTLWLPFLRGSFVIYHHHPIEGEVIGKLIHDNNASLLMTTPTFLTNYIRKFAREQVQSLRYVICGAEKLSDTTRKAFYDKFGIEALEGYGATELSPIACMNITSYKDKGIHQVGNKSGKIGHPLPGVVVRVANPDTFEELDQDQSGLLLIKGPNVMKGYLQAEDKTNEVLQNGWYITGDIGHIDEDGFVTITDRLSRFSKIGGEMVPHIKVEEAIQQILNHNERVCAVTAVPCPKKGEKLIVFHTLELDTQHVIQSLAEQGLPALWIPKREQFFKIDEFPLLGSGKMDLAQIKQMAEARNEHAN